MNPAQTIIRGIFLVVLALIASKAIAESSSFRSKTSPVIGGNVLKFFLNERGDCAIFQALNADGSKVNSTQKICGFEGRSFWDEVTDAHFYDISFSEQGIEFYISITPLYPIKEKIIKCFAPIHKSKLLPIKCKNFALNE